MVEVLPQGELVAVPDVGNAPTLMGPVVRGALERFLSAGETVAPPAASQRVEGR